MGLDDKRTPQMLPGPTSWTEQEERRRIWWAVIVLDRIVSIGLLGRQVSINVNLDSVLPVDDNAWSRGEANVAQPLGLSASAQVKAAPFARTCQAAHLMGRIIDHVTDRRMTVESRYGEAFHLHQALTAFTAACSIDDRADQEYGILFYTAAAMCCSASLTLYEHYACPDNVPEGSPEAHLAMQKLSLEGLAAVSEQVLRLAVKLTAYVEVNGSASVSPFMLDAIYQAGANFVWYIREANDESKREQLNIIRRLLRLLEGKWHVAAEYLGIIHRFERRMSPS
ncbi:Hypothetical protein D9617_7g031130 [Elsinoe fawcettii]|nr:Hypothetical protein D9617_7g031130 [Elsinoe fawcettii]